MEKTIALQCDLCLEDFNQDFRTPYSLILCGHTISQICLYEICTTKKACPWCRESFHGQIVNRFILENIRPSKNPVNIPDPDKLKRIKMFFKKDSERLNTRFISLGIVSYL